MKAVSFCLIWGLLRTVAQETASHSSEELLQRGKGGATVYKNFFAK